MQDLVVDLSGAQAGKQLTLELPGEGRRAEVTFRLEGRARPHVSAVLTGYTEDVANLAADVPFGFHRVEYRAAAARYRGHALPAGFGVLSDPSGAWTNTTSELEMGRTTHVQVDLWRQQESGETSGDYLVLEIPVPAGARMLEGSFNGGLGHFEQRDGAVIVPIGPQLDGAGISFTLLGVDPGSFHVRAPVLRSAYEPGRARVHEGRGFAVLDRGETSSDTYRPTPDELFQHGTRLFGDANLSGAGEKLGLLYREHEGNLRTSDLRSLARMMLTISLEARDPALAVRFFEVLREKDSGYTVPFDQIVAIGEAYRDLGEFERAYLIFRATALETFGKDLEVAGTLQDQGERAGALDVLDELTLAYPDLPSVVEARLALADQLLSLAHGAHRDASLVRAGYDRAALTQRGILQLKRFLALHPDSSLAPDAGLGLVSAYLGMDDAETAARLAGEMAELFTQPRFADAFTYTQAVAQWHLGQEEHAKELLARIAAAEYTDERGNTTGSENRDLALYILGQIAHAKQDADTAEEFYDRVDHLFADAKEALESFRHRALVLKEVTTARPGQAISLEMEVQNVHEVELLVYAVDLMTLYLREKDLSQVTAVNLAGIAPTLATTIAIDEGRDLREREATAELALTEPGAYLVIARSGGLHASGLVLVTDLELEVVEDAVSGRVRVQALDRGDGRYLRDVDVRVVGSASGSFVNGETDPRGLFLADGVAGMATVVARQGDHYAFHRGARTIAPKPQRSDYQFAAPLQSDAYFQNVLEFNDARQNERGMRLEKEIRKSKEGVQLDQIR
ncbi:MAG: hypothetical protein O2816_02605, partial [Planctomycetota bacterium]|nr:hypothetical protein [Planctomycetota bacterium]